MAHLLAKQGKPFRDEFIKMHLTEAAKEMYPEERNLFNIVSAGTVAQRTENIGDSINSQLITKANHLNGFHWLLMVLLLLSCCLFKESMTSLK